jgi:hypothetical protein
MNQKSILPTKYVTLSKQKKLEEKVVAFHGKYFEVLILNSLDIN